VVPDALYCCVSTSLNFSKYFTLWASLSATPQQVGIAAFTASALLQDIRGKLLQLHALRLAAAAKSAIADFREPEDFYHARAKNDDD
jgi:hypothetical protein